MATIDTSKEVGGNAPANPPRENLVRATPGINIRNTSGDTPLLSGHFAVWGQWTEIRSAYEGNFMERFDASSMTKTLSESTPKVLFQHGKDPQVGDKPLGSIRSLQPDDTGAYYEVDMFNTSYNRDLIPGLQAGAYGASFRFSVVRESVSQRPAKSDYNPRGIPERTVEEARVLEFGPVTFPAYSGATAGVRSMTDEFLFATLAADRELALRTGISLAGVRTPFQARYDNEDTGCLAQMLVLATCYIDDQDETDDASDITSMTGVVKTLSGLLAGEITEVEPPEPDDEMNSLTLDGEERAVWTTAYVDTLPDSSFLYVESGGSKDGDGKTVPRSLRHFPYKDAGGTVDLPHLRNALARIPQSSLPASVKDELTAKATKLLAAASGRDMEPESSETTTLTAPGIEPEPSGATTHSLTTDLFRFAAPPKHMRSK